MMKKIVSLIVLIVLLFGSFLVYSQFYQKKHVSLLLDPQVPNDVVGMVQTVATDSAQLVPDTPVDCVLTYGTFSVSQPDCDELTEADTNQNLSEDTISCHLTEGVFSVTQRECDLLKRAVGSRDVLQSLDK